jgi:hypothetical protein
VLLQRLAFLGLGIVVAAFGWVFYSDPQRGFRIHSWPSVPAGEDGLTEAGKRPVRIRGLFLMGLGVVICLVAFAL